MAELSLFVTVHPDFSVFCVIALVVIVSWVVDIIQTAIRRKS